MTFLRSTLARGRICSLSRPRLGFQEGCLGLKAGGRIHLGFSLFFKEQNNF